ncbi:MAG: serine hydrolase domain-containing protein [Cyanobacteriota bacterium]|nr:serine hydrolase domain-containing protein [Cyanobacteriota bacterium]
MIDEYVQDVMTKQQIPGMSLAIVKEGKPLLVKGYGIANLEHSVPVTEKTVFEVASVGKTFTAIVVMMLVEEGVIDLDRAIAEYLDNLPIAWHSVKVRHILSHQSGLPNYTNVENYWTEIIRLNLSQTEIINLVRDQPLMFEPGEYFSYDNTGYYLLGMMLQQVTGISYADLIRERLFQPLGMNATRMNNPNEIVLHRASGYRLPKKQLVNKPYYSPSVTFSAGGQLSSIEDMVKYEQELCSPTLLQQSTLDLMWTHYPASRGENSPLERYTGYLRAGLGWLMPDYPDRRVVGHNGSIVGFASNITRFIDDQLTVILFCNLDRIIRPDAIAKEIANYYCPALASLPIQPPLK